MWTEQDEKAGIEPFPFHDIKSGGLGSAPQRQLWGSQVSQYAKGLCTQTTGSGGDKMKQCNKCGESKSPDNFYRQPTKLDGLDGTCKQCRKEARASRYHSGGKQKEREYQSKNKDKRQAYWLAYDAKPESKAKRLQYERDVSERGRAKAARHEVENNQRIPPPPPTWTPLRRFMRKHLEPL